MKKLLAVLVVWVACGVFGFGGTMAFFSNEFPMESDGTHALLNWHEKPSGHETWRAHLGISSFVGLAGPFGLIAATLLTGFYSDGFSWTVEDVREINNRNVIAAGKPQLVEKK